MIEELATVVAIRENSDNQHQSRHGTNKHRIITVESQIKSTCSGCKQVDNCGSGQVSKAIPQKRLRLELSTNKIVAIGDIVVLGISEKSMLNTAWQVYLWPLIGLISCSAIGQWMFNQQWLSHELYALLIGVIGGYCGHRLARFWQTYSKQALALMPKIIRIAPKELHIMSAN